MIVKMILEGKVDEAVKTMSNKNIRNLFVEGFIQKAYNEIVIKEKKLDIFAEFLEKLKTRENEFWYPVHEIFTYKDIDMLKNLMDFCNKRGYLTFYPLEKSV